MKKKELVQIREKKIEELVKMVDDKKKELVGIYGKVKVGRESNLKKAKNLRLDIVQIMSVASQKKGEKKR